MNSLRLALTTIAVALLLTACTTLDTAALRIGMTKDEAIKVMGAPNSISAQGGVEYLNYTLSESGAYGGYWTRPYYVRIADGRVQAYGYSEQINRLAPPGGAFANAAGKSAGLRAGMTRAEAIAVMGSPNSVSAQAPYEYLNYTSSEVSPSGIGTMTRPYYVRLLDGKVDAFGFTDQIGRTFLPSSVSTSTASSFSHSGGSIAILSVSPSTLTTGRSQDIAVKVRYTAQSGDKFRVVIMANTSGATRFQPIGEQIVDDRSGEITINARVSPVDWGEGNQFRLIAQLFPYPPGPGQSFRPVAYGMPYALPLAP